MMIRRMTLDELAMVLGWARDEGWNPGLDDAAAFHAADPDGFFLALIDDTPVAAISVVNHDESHAFLGLYICLPAYRGTGCGYALWQDALRHAGSRSVTLEGVPDQQANYIRSGFARIGRTIRYKGEVSAENEAIHAATPDDVPALLNADKAAAGHARPAYAQAWFSNCATRQTQVLTRPTGAIQFATFRKCHDGLKIGPLHANDRSSALALLRARPTQFGDGPLYIDVPDGSALQALVIENGFEPVFETAKMVLGRPTAANPPAFYSVATLELG